MNSSITNNSNSIDSEMNKYITPYTPTSSLPSFPETNEPKDKTGEEIIDSDVRLSKFHNAEHMDVAALIRKHYSKHGDSEMSDNERKLKKKLSADEKMEKQDSSSSSEDDEPEYKHSGSRKKVDGTRRFLLRGQSRAVWDDDHLDETTAAMSNALQDMEFQMQMQKKQNNNRYDYGDKLKSGKDSPSSSLFRLQSSATWTKDDVNEELDEMQQQLAHLIETKIRVEEASVAASSIGDVRINSDEDDDEKDIIVDEEVLKVYKRDENGHSTVHISDNDDELLLLPS